MMRILFVDAGNYCRSPVAEVVARKLAAERGKRQLVFSSAGLKDKHAGTPADPRSVSACQARGYDLSAFRCRQITVRDFLEHDVILAMDRDNLAQLQSLRPAAATVQIELFLDDAEVPDPYYGGDDGFDLMMDQIEAGTRALIARRG
ncbi:MAG: low molecular weight phosphotyrosine protein phosphatase [Gammaproteobacteria bacterium]|nr:low molecular weight phosphotyrosine protein phosphatase [Gammaproteobacteria bacterium]